MALLINMAVIITMAVVLKHGRGSRVITVVPRSPDKGEDLVAELFRADGWKVQRDVAIGRYRADFLVQKQSQVFVIEVKAFSEGRPDRVIPLLSHALVQAQAFARAHGRARPLAIVHLGAASQSLVKHIQEFVRDFASGVAVGIVSENGLCYFVGDGLESLNAEPQYVRGSHEKAPSLAHHLFSDLNQWMLKVLLAPEIPEQWLSAPRDIYRNASEFAKAADALKKVSSAA